MLYQHVTGLKLELARDIADADYDMPTNSFARPEHRTHWCRYIQPWFECAFRQYKLRLERVGNIILHDLECTFRLRIAEGHAELIEAPFRETLHGNFPFRVLEKSALLLLFQIFAGWLCPGLSSQPFQLCREEFAVMLLLEPLEHRAPDPASAVVGSKLPVGHNEHAGLRFLDHHLAGRDENPEIDHSRLRPMLKALGNRHAVLAVHKVKLAIVGGATGTDQFVVSPVPDQPC